MIYRLIITIFLISTTCFAHDEDDDIKIAGRIMPLRHELLQETISLSNNCTDIKIIEWRDLEKINKSDRIMITNKLSFICNKAINLFQKFSNEHNINVAFTIPKATISIIPEDNNYRSLNDFDYRFRIYNSCDKYGKKCTNNEKRNEIVGLFMPINKHLFITNKVNANFYTTFTHEMFHVLSNASKLRNNISTEQEEKLAYNFELYMLNN